MNYVKDFLFVATVMVVAVVAMNYFNFHPGRDVMGVVIGLAISAFVAQRHVRGRVARARAARTPQGNAIADRAPIKTIVEKPYDSGRR